MFRFGKQKTTNLANDQNDSSKWNDRYPYRIERGHKGAELQALPALAGFDRSYFIAQFITHYLLIIQIPRKHINDGDVQCSKWRKARPNKKEEGNINNFAKILYTTINKKAKYVDIWFVGGWRISFSFKLKS